MARPSAERGGGLGKETTNSSDGRTSRLLVVEMATGSMRMIRVGGKRMAAMSPRTEPAALAGSSKQERLLPPARVTGRGHAYSRIFPDVRISSPDSIDRTRMLVGWAGNLGTAVYTWYSKYWKR